MCGILVRAAATPSERFESALATIRSRGPDATGVWQDGGIQLGHQRLAIIDLSGGQQPMASPDGRYRIVFNGEIYNYRQLREELVSRGCRFQTASDTEVLLRGHEAWGTAMLARLDGIFAYAVWDSHLRRLTLARDRLGVKPLYYVQDGAGISAASTLRPLLALHPGERSLEWGALKDYLSSEFVPTPATLVQGFKVLPPAYYAVYDAQSHDFTLSRYWDICQPGSESPADGELVERVAAALEESVGRQLVSDVPLGAFLSGGIDSSLVVAAMTRKTASRVVTFSMGFRGLSAAADESDHAREVAKALGTEHHELDARDIDGGQMVAMIEELDQPLADPAYLPLSMLCRSCRERITVALSGDGGDELFGGYGRYLKDYHHFDTVAARLRTWLRPLVEARMLPDRIYSATLSGNDRVLWNNFSYGDYRVSRKSLRPILTADAAEIVDGYEAMSVWKRRAGEFSPRWDTDTLMRCDLWSYLSDNCLVKTDRASMATGLEVRVPLLGNSLVDTVLPWHARVKLRHGPKWLLKELCRRYRLPEQTWNRPKHGFSVPLAEYFQGSWREVCEETVAECGQIAPFLNERGVQKLWRQVLKSRQGARRMWAIIVLLIWLRAHRVTA